MMAVAINKERFHDGSGDFDNIRIFDYEGSGKFNGDDHDYYSWCSAHGSRNGDGYGLGSDMRYNDGSTSYDDGGGEGYWSGWGKGNNHGDGGDGDG